MKWHKPVGHLSFKFFVVVVVVVVLLHAVRVFVFQLIYFMLLFCILSLPKLFDNSLSLVFVSMKVNETEVFVDGHDFKFFSKPYYLRLLAVIMT